MYRCDVCTAVSKPKQDRLVHVVHRKVARPALDSEDPRTEVDREIPVCQECKLLLDHGLPLASLLRQRGKRQEAVGQAPKPQPKPFEFHPVFLGAQR